MPRRVGNGPGHGGPAQGAGYGGPAKGYVPNPNKQQKFGAGTNAQGHNATTPAPFNRAELRRQRADKLEEHLYGLALGAVEQRDQINASKALHAICDGTPVARQEIAGADGGPLQIVYGWADEPGVAE